MTGRGLSTVLWVAVVCAALVGCTPTSPEVPAPTTSVTGGATATPDGPAPGTPDATGSPNGSVTPDASPSTGPATDALRWADGTPVEGTSLDLGATRRVRLGTDVTRVRDVPAEPGTGTFLMDLRSDGSFLTVVTDAEPSGDGGGTVGALREVTKQGARTLERPHDDDPAWPARIVAARRIDGGIVWLESPDGIDQRLVLAPDGSSSGRVVAQVTDGAWNVSVLARWGAVLDDGRVLGWDGTMRGEAAGLQLELSHTAAGGDVVERRCRLAVCEIVMLTESGRSEPLLRGSGLTSVECSDGRYVLVDLEREDGSAEVWGVDTVGRTAVRIVGDLWCDAMSGGRLVVDETSHVVLVDLVAGTSEQLAVDAGIRSLAIAGDLVGVTASGNEGAGADGDGGDVLRWPGR